MLFGLDNGAQGGGLPDIAGKIRGCEVRGNTEGGHPFGNDVHSPPDECLMNL
jgi:hypothetical protein